MKSFISSKLFISVSSFIIGAVVTYFVTDYTRLKQMSQSKVSLSDRKSSSPSQVSKKINSDPFDRIDQISKHMDQQMDKMFDASFFGPNHFSFQSDVFDNSFNNDVQITEREDEDYKYIEVSGKGVNKDNLEVNISDGMISISGEINKTEENNNNRSFSSSNYISKFSKSFNIPFGVIEDKAIIESNDDLILIKFPKANG